MEESRVAPRGLWQPHNVTVVSVQAHIQGAGLPGSMRSGGSAQVRTQRAGCSAASGYEQKSPERVRCVSE